MGQRGKARGVEPEVLSQRCGARGVELQVLSERRCARGVEPEGQVSNEWYGRLSVELWARRQRHRASDDEAEVSSQRY